MTIGDHQGSLTYIGTVGKHEGPLTCLQGQYETTRVHWLTSSDSRESSGSTDLSIGTVGEPPGSTDTLGTLENHQGLTYWDSTIGTVGNHQVHYLTSRDSRKPPGSIDIPLGTVGKHQGQLTPLGTVGNHQIRYLTSRDSREPPESIESSLLTVGNHPGQLPYH